MAKREPSKADLVLREVQNRIDLAQQEVNAARQKLELAQVSLLAYQNTYDDLKRTLEVRRSQPQKREKKTDNPRCSICGCFRDEAIHDTTYISSHPFAGPGTAPPVKKRSSRRGADTLSTQNIEADKGNALSASGD